MKQKGFTLTELATTTVILGMMVAFAIPNFTKAFNMEKARSVYSQLLAVKLAQNTYQGAYDRYYTASSHITDLEAISDNLRVDITPPDGMSFRIRRNASGRNFTAEFLRDGSNTALYRVADGTEPCCVGSSVACPGEMLQC